MYHIDLDLGPQWKWRLYMTLVSGTLFVIPAFLIGGCHIIIVIIIWRKERTQDSTLASSIGIKV